MTYVYSVLANQGEQAGIDSVLGLPKGNRPLDPIAVLKVETVDGKTLWQAKPKQGAHRPGQRRLPDHQHPRGRQRPRLDVRRQQPPEPAGRPAP